MQKIVNKLKVLAIIIYLFPILFVSIFTQSIDYFLLSTGIMTILLGLCMNFAPHYLGYNKSADKYHSSTFIGISGILLLLLYTMGL
ncbi:hypothetical protein Ccel_3121 [Ruminiclostridium cellulolyticum H10]|uniref:Uncharacterized protein n=1 Tax=Ruminiclostridium cellulolyticum (strain ATCC 35319 / DSM 5812 / JCM 6584 / H10) TaxID=394503 RepID=B8I086_RUMCH|nr:hypothetical protein Ccel_3121 [Ruminiclostridium cellulolyticum H10]